uniref:Uncharacterized protein n=1 Tax=Arundo donax TaxID=35708 RepID=A0A0A9GVK3_ARUDO
MQGAKCYECKSHLICRKNDKEH